jgi:hypothetical protein
MMPTTRLPPVIRNILGIGLLASVSTAGCASLRTRQRPAPHPPIAAARAGTGGLPQGSWVEIYFRTFDSVTVASGLQPLRSTALPPGQREVRIWIGGGIGYPQRLYRVYDTAGGVSGELVLHWPDPPPDLSSGERTGQTFHDIVVYSQRGRCTGFRTAAGTGVCRALFTRPPDWGDLLGRMEADGLWTLPDPSTFPDDGVLALDGWGITVELREGGSYRAYQYSNPHHHPRWPQAKQAEAIARTLAGVDSLLRTPDVVQVYRGVTSGAFRGGFRACGGEQEWEFRGDLHRLAEQDSMALPALPRGATEYFVEVRGSLELEWLTRRNGSRYPRALNVRDLLSVRPWTGAECETAPAPAGGAD